MAKDRNVYAVHPDSTPEFSFSQPGVSSPLSTSRRQQNYRPLPIPAVSGTPTTTPDTTTTTTLRRLPSQSSSPSSMSRTTPELSLLIPIQQSPGMSDQGHKSTNSQVCAAQPPSSSSPTVRTLLNVSTSTSPASSLSPSTAIPSRVHSFPHTLRSSQSTPPSTIRPTPPTPTYPTSQQQSTTVYPHNSSTLQPLPVDKLTRKSRSRLNLSSSSSSSSSQSKLRHKHSTHTLVPQLPTQQIIDKRAYNLNPVKVFINRLPHEVLQVVFLLLINPSSSSSSTSLYGYESSLSLSVGLTGGREGGVDTKAPRTVSQVCHLWRCIALNEPLLWARTLNLRQGPKWIIETLKRSGECMIDVVGLRETSSSSSRFRGARGEYPRNGRGGSVLGVILGELKRIRKLHLTIESKEDWRMFADALCKSDAPVLESLTVKSSVRRGVNVPGVLYGREYGDHSFSPGLESFRDGGGVGGACGGADEMRFSEGMFKGSAPVLKNISLTMVTLSAVDPLPYLSHLTTLQVTDLEYASLMSIWSWLSIVRQTPLLQSLVLRYVFAHDIQPSSPSHSTNVVLKKLNFIELKGSMMEACEFLEKLVVPGECKLVMSLGRANNAYATGVLGDWLRERKMRSEQMEGILRTPKEVVRNQEMERRTGRWLLVHPSIGGLMIKVNEVVCPPEGEERSYGDLEDEADCVVNLALSFGFTNSTEDRHRLIIDIFNILTQALQMVYEDRGGFDALNLSLFGVRDGIRVWEDQLVQFLAGLDRVEHLQEISGYTASVLFPLLVQSPFRDRHQRRGSTTSFTSIISTSPSERFRLNVLLPSLSKITLAFVEFGKNVDDEFEASCDVCAVPDFVRRRYGLGKEIGGISVVRQKVGSVSVRFECCSGPKSILNELSKLEVEFGLGWACDFEDDLQTESAI